MYQISFIQKKNSQRAKELHTHLTDYRKSIKELKPKIDSCLNLFKVKKSEFNNIDNQLKNMQSNLDNAQDKRWEVQQILSDNTIELGENNTVSFYKYNRSR